VISTLTQAERTRARASALDMRANADAILQELERQR
jgi:hypothetical protein